MKRRIILFDFDGTITDFKAIAGPLLSGFSAAHGLNCDLEKFYRGYVDPERFDLGWGLALEEQPALFEAYEQFAIHEMVHKRNFIPPLFPSALETLQRLDEDYDLGLVTARDRASMTAILREHNLLDIFALFRSSCCVRESGMRIKPAPDAVHSLLSESKHSIENAVVVGDTTSDIHMANQAGVKSIAAAWGLHSAEALAAANPSRMAQHIAEIPTMVSDLFQDV